MKIANGSFPIDWEESEDALYVEGLKIPSSVRTIGDMKDVLYDAEFAKSADKSKVLYYMHRGVLRRRDSALFESNRRRFDVTVVLPGTLGSEFTKTVGHYHELSPAAGHQSYPEIYEILHGAAHFMIFSRMVRAGQDIDNEIADCALIEAEAGQKVFMPPNYGHIMINPGSELLVTSNIVESNFKSLYEPVGKMKGGPYFELSNGTTAPNKLYRSLPRLRKETAGLHKPTLALRLDASKTIYDIFLHSPEKFGFLEPK